MKLYPKRTLPQRYKAVRRVTHLSDLSSVVGKQLISNSFRLLPWMTVAAGAVFTYEKVTDEQLYKAVLPFLAFPLMLGTGLGLKTIPRFVKGRRLSYSRANSADLLAHHRVSQQDDIVNYLVDNVCFPESQAHFTPAQIAAEAADVTKYEGIFEALLKTADSDALKWAGLEKQSDFDVATRSIVTQHALKNEQNVSEKTLPNLKDRIKKSKEGIKISLEAALNDSLSQPDSLMKTGYNIKILEEWFGGAPFDGLDKKLELRLKMSPRIKKIRKLTKKSNYLNKYESAIHYMRTGAAAAFSKHFVFAETHICAGGLLKDAREQFPKATEISIESILRPEANNDSYHVQFAGLPEMIQEGRESFIRGIYGLDTQEAEHTVNSKTLHPIFDAMALRIKYDPEYAGYGDLGSRTFIDDLSELGVCNNDLESLQTEIVSQNKLYENEITRIAPNCTSDQRRALHIAFHIDYNGIKKPKRRARAVQSVLRETEDFSERLIELRMLQSFTMIDRRCYLKDVLSLGGYKLE